LFVGAPYPRVDLRSDVNASLRCSLRSTLLVTAMLALTTDAFAQTNSMFGSSAGRGTSGSTGSTGGRSSSSSGFSSFNNSRQSTGQQSQFGQNQQGRTGGTGTLQQTAGTARQGLVGRADTAGRFVGSAQAAQQSFGTGANGLGQTLGGQSRGRGRQSGLFGGGEGNEGLGAGGGGTSAYRIPIPQQKVAFDYTPPAGRVVSQRISTQLDKVRTKLPVRNTEIFVEEGTVTLRGVVAKESDRKLAEQLVRLEPGVRQVVNELTVAE
jgi:hypothetical protein